VTSPGGNLVEIRVVAVDQTGPGFDSATKKAKGLAQAVAGGPGSAAGALKEAEKQASGLGSTLRRVGEVAGGVLVADAVQAMAQRAVALVKSTAKAASDLGESVNAVNKTFEASSQQVVQWGEDNANAFGLSQRAFNQMAVPLGAMLKNQGLQLDEVTDHTLKLTQRAADMASVFNTDVTDALMAIQAGLRGEIDPLERYGVSLSAAAVEARALADSGKESAKELTAQEKALARLNILYEQTADTAGDFADTSDGLANSQRIMRAQIEDAQATIGTSFMPVLAKAAQFAGNLAESFAGMPAPLQIASAAVVGLAGAIGLLAPKALAAKAALDEMAVSDSRLQRGMAKTTVAVGKAGAAFAALGLAVAGLSAVFGDDLNPQVEAAAKGLTEWNKRAKLSGEAARLFGEDTKVLEMSMQQLAQGGLYKAGDQVGQFLSSLVGAPGPLGRAKEHVDAFDSALVQMVQGGHADEAAEAVARLAELTGISIEDALKLLPQYSGAVEVGARKTSELGRAAEETALGIDELRKSTKEYLDEAFSLEEAQDQVAESTQRLIEQLKKQHEEEVAGAGALTGNTEAALANREMVRTLTEDYSRMILETAEAGRSTDDLRGELQTLLVNLGFGAAEAERYTRELAGLEQQLAQIKSKEVKIRVKVEQGQIFGGGATEFAHGGITGAASGGVRSGLQVVNEQGPELARIPTGDIVSLPTGSTVIPHGQSMAMLANGGGGQIAWAAPVVFNPPWDTFFAGFRDEIQARGGTLAVIGIRNG